MKSTILLAAAAAGLAEAKPHGHAHFHHKRVPDAVTTVSTPVATTLAFVLSDGSPISQAQVCDGIAKGELKWEGSAPDNACVAASSVSIPASSQSTSSSSSAAAGAFYAQSSSSQAAPSPSPSSSSGSNTSGGFVASGNSNFPNFQDGTHRCSDGVPSGYGAIAVPYLNLDGWTGAQKLNPSLNDILSDSGSCGPGVSCSYACEPGLQKTQWVAEQPADGASIGGLLCHDDGFLYRANDHPGMCEQGTGGVTIVNQGGDRLSCCRTDYPGSESETIPVDIQAGASQPLTCPDESSYYKHLNADTSAQYYLNPWGVGSDPGCSWNGLGDGKTGNWAGINFGVGSTNGVKWLAIMQNSPTSKAVFPGKISIEGDGLSGSCTYQADPDGQDGTYCGATGCNKISSGGNVGCTVSATGNARFVVSH